MLVVMAHDATAKDVDRVVNIIQEMGYEARPMPGAQRTAVGLVGNDGRVDASRLEALPGVAQIIHVTQPYKQVSREWRSENTVVELGPGVIVGGESVVVIGGPCSVESEEQILSAARIVKAAGGNALRGGAFKPRSSPYSFQGLGEKGLELLARAGKATGLPIVTEAMDSEGAQLVAELADCIQIGARNMQNYSLLKTVGRMKKPVLLKRGMAATSPPRKQELHSRCPVPEDMRKLTTLAALAFVGIHVSAQAQDAGATIDRAAAAYARLNSMRAEFQQTLTNPLTGNSQTSSGVIVRKKP